MSLQGHIVELQRRHEALKKELELAKRHPLTEEAKILEIKRKKLILKDEIEKLRQSETRH
jgi:hypothetical protein